MENLLQAFISTLDAAFKEQLSQVADLNLTVSQTVYIEAIAKLGQPSITELARGLGVTRASVTVGVNKLAKQGYVSKLRSSEDKRVVRLSLTPVSEQLIEARHQVLASYSASVRAALTPAEAQQFEAIITKLIEHFS